MSDITAKEYYDQIKEFVHSLLNGVPFQIADKVTCPVEWAKTFFPMISDCVHREDYEGAQATKDAIIEFLNKFGLEIPEDAQLKIPEYKETEMHGILCLAKEGDISGLASGGAILF